MVPPASGTSSLSDTLKRHATALTTALFALIAFSGVMMFFHISSYALRFMHEWLGMLFVIAAGFHVARHWRAFMHMLGKGESLIAIAAVVMVAAVLLALAPAERGGRHGLSHPSSFNGLESPSMGQAGRSYR